VDAHRVKRILVTPWILTRIFVTGEVHLAVDGIPADYQFRGFTIDPTTNCISLFIEHPSFELTPYSEVTPEMQITMRDISNREVR